MRVGLVTTWDTACGIAEHSAMLVEAVHAADPAITFKMITDLHPAALDRLETPHTKPPIDLLVLNYHAALHSQWTPAAILHARDRYGIPVAVIYHDTGVPNSLQCKEICAAADAAIVHEPFDDLVGQVHYCRMGVPDWTGEWEYDRSSEGSWCGRRPILGSIGFPFPWKNYDKLAEITAAVGWALLLIAPGATGEQVMAWASINPHLWVERTFLHRRIAVAHLAACDATAFLYTCANTGQSAAILQGIAARQPVIAFPSCRQFRALFADPLGRTAIQWTENFETFRSTLVHFTPIQRVHPPTVALAEQDSWAKLGTQYARLFRELTKPKEVRF